MLVSKTILSICVAAVLLTACGGEGAEDPAPPPSADGFEVTSPDLTSGEQMDVRFTCDGEGAAPTIGWSGVPEGTEELVLTLTDPDAPMDRSFVHWAVFGIPPETPAILSGALPEGAEAGTGDGGPGYTAPCPPEGETHTYIVTLYALSEDSGVSADSPPEDYATAFADAAIAAVTLDVSYGR